MSSTEPGRRRPRPGARPATDVVSETTTTAQSHRRENANWVNVAKIGALSGASVVLCAALITATTIGDERARAPEPSHPVDGSGVLARAEPSDGADFPSAATDTATSSLNSFAPLPPPVAPDAAPRRPSEPGNTVVDASERDVAPRRGDPTPRTPNIPAGSRSTQRESIAPARSSAPSTQHTFDSSAGPRDEGVRDDLVRGSRSPKTAVGSDTEAPSAQPYRLQAAAPATTDRQLATVRNLYRDPAAHAGLFYGLMPDVLAGLFGRTPTVDSLSASAPSQVLATVAVQHLDGTVTRLQQLVTLDESVDPIVTNVRTLSIRRP